MRRGAAGTSQLGSFIGRRSDQTDRRANRRASLAAKVVHATATLVSVLGDARRRGDLRGGVVGVQMKPKLKLGDVAICGYIRIRFPDGSERREKLPSSCHVKLGGKYIHMVVWGQKLIPIYFERVKGGWRPFNR